MSNHNLSGLPGSSTPLTSKQTVDLFMKGLDLIRESGMFDKCGAYAPAGWDDDNSEITAIYLSNDSEFIAHCQKYQAAKEGED